MSVSPCSSAHLIDDVLYGDDNTKFVQPVVNSSSAYVSLASSQVDVSSLTSSSSQSQTYKHFLAQKYAAESTSDGDAESHSNSVNGITPNSQAYSHHISSFYPFSPLVSSSSHFDSRTILGEAVLESTVDSLQVESSTNEQQNNSSHATSQALFNDNIANIETFIKPEDAVNLPLASNSSVTSSSTNPNDNMCRVELVPSTFFDTITTDITVDSTTTANISTSNSLNSSLSSYPFTSFQTTSSQVSLPGVLTYGLASNFPSSLLQLDNSQQLLPSLHSPSNVIDQFFNHQSSHEKRVEDVILDAPLLPSAMQSFGTDNGCILPDNFLHDIPNESYGETESISTQDNVIRDLPVLSRARASLPIEFLYLNETNSGVGVYARKTIPKRTQFGPAEGVIASLSENNFSPSSIALSSKNNLIIFISELVILSQEDENNSNWTRFVRPASSPDEQNLELITREFVSANELKFFFYTTRTIMPHEELKVWYSKQYANQFRIPLLDNSELAEGDLESNSNTNNLAAGGHKLRNKIAKSQLSQSQSGQENNKQSQPGSDQSPNENGVSFADQPIISIDLNKVAKLNNVDSSECTNGPSMVNGKVNNNEVNTGKPKEAKGNQYQCDICKRVFPRHYSLRRHQVMHSDTGEKRYKCPVCGMAFNHVYNRNRHLKKHNKPLAANKIMGKNSQIEQLNETNANELPSVPITVASMQINTNTTVTNNSNNTTTINSSSPISSPTVIFSTSNEYQPMKSASVNCRNQLTTNENKTQTEGQPLSIHSPLSASPDNKISNEQVTSSVLTNQTEIESQATVKSITSSKSNLSNIEKLFRCSICYKRFSSQERLTKHALVHDESAKQLSCQICKRKFLTNSALVCHIKSHSFSVNEPRKYDCTLCGQVFDSILHRRDHVAVHINPETGLFHCSKCPKTFEGFTPIRKHIKSFHSDEIFPCTQCDKVFPRQDKLRLHMLCHTDRWEFKCNFCQKQFKRKDKLKEHTQRMHAPDRDVRIAAKMAARIQRLKAQRTKKVASKPSQPNYHEFIYKCHQCLLGFKRRGMLVNHLAKRHPDVPYNTVPELNMPIVKTSKDYLCQYCDKVYKSSSKRKAHIIKNHPGKSLPPSNRSKSIISDLPNASYSKTAGSITIEPHFCGWCHKQYASKAKLMQHQRKKHPDQIEAFLAMKVAKPNENSFTSTSSSDSSVTGSQMESSVTTTASTAGETLIKQVEVKIEQDNASLVPVIKQPQMTNYLATPTHQGSSFIENFSIGGSYSKGETFIHNGQLQSSDAQYALDSAEQSLEDLLNLNMEPNQNLLINNSSAPQGTLTNNIITILTCTVPPNGNAYSSEVAEFSSGITDIITQIASTDFDGSKQLLNVSQSDQLSNSTVGNNLIISESIEDSNWSQVCEEMAMV